MPWLSSYARIRKIAYFIVDLPKDARILEVGCGDGWLGRYLREGGWKNYSGLDLAPPADVPGDIRGWADLGLAAASFDVVIAFEVAEHVNCFREFYDLLRPGGLLLLTSPLPHLDWLCRLLELVGLSQPRCSPHDHLIRFPDIPLFVPLEIRRVGFISQWGKFRKPADSEGTPLGA
jgi:SAM-dependent methyltransferase